MRSSLYFLVCLCASWNSSVQAATFTEFFGLNVVVPQIGHSATGGVENGALGTAIGGGFLLGFDVAPRWKLEWGALYLAQNFSQRDPLENHFHSRWLQIPLAVRYGFSKQWSAAFGWYWSQAVGTISMTALGETRRLGYNQQGWKTHELGLFTSVRYSFCLNEFLIGIFEERFSLSLTPLSRQDASPPVLSIDAWQSWIGVSVSL